MEFLPPHLHKGPKRAKLIYAAGLSEDPPIHEKALSRAATKLGVKRERERRPNGSFGAIAWSNPRQSPQDHRTPQDLGLSSG